MRFPLVMTSQIRTRYVPDCDDKPVLQPAPRAPVPVPARLGGDAYQTVLD